MAATSPFFQWHLIVAYGFGILLLLVVGRLLIGPVKWAIRALVSITWGGLSGVILLIVFNFIGGSFGLYVPLNPITALIVGLLKLPGLALVIILRYIT